jgi:hypothetical protein
MSNNPVLIRTPRELDSQEFSQQVGLLVFDYVPRRLG